jgi:uncharacterized repeat protein (TIGR03803 family)
VLNKRFLIVLSQALFVISGFLITVPSWAASTFKALHSFTGKDGAYPFADLVFDAAGNLYGTTLGNFCEQHSCGTVFKLAPGANGLWTRTVLHYFGGKDGCEPYARLVFDTAGNLYGTTSCGGANGGGTVFELSPGAGGKWTEKVLYSFSTAGKDGHLPYAGLIFDTAGNLYGATNQGGAYGGGAVFELSPAADGKWTPAVLHVFGKGKDGSAPRAGLTFDSAGNLYGTTFAGGSSGDGIVFKLAPKTRPELKWLEGNCPL